MGESGFKRAKAGIGGALEEKQPGSQPPGCFHCSHKDVIKS